MNLINIVIIILVGIFPACIYLLKEKNTPTNKESLLIALGTTILSVIISWLGLKETNTPNDIPSFIIGAIINFFLVLNLANQKIEIKTFIKFTLTLLLFFCSSLFQYIPITLFKITENTITPEIVNYLTCFSDGCLLIILVLMYYEDLKKGLLNLKQNFNSLFDQSFKVWMIGFLGMMASNILIHLLTPSAVAGNENTVQGMISTSPLIMFICAGLMAPIIEELCFRKAFQNIIKNRHLFILTSGIVFGLLHVIFSYQNLIDFVYILPYASLGIAFAYLVDKTDNICTSILMHCLHNSSIIGISLLTGMIIL